eukprot:2525650-Alexandrium_andersonii.AAC.1
MPSEERTGTRIPSSATSGRILRHPASRPRPEARGLVEKYKRCAHGFAKRPNLAEQWAPTAQHV